MPKKTINDYTFYKIINVNCDIDLCYVGSTVDMKGRTRRHKSNCNNVNGSRYNLKVYQTIRQHGGWDEFKIIPIGYAEQLTLTEAHVMEEKYRVELCAELNGKRCHITEEQCKERDALSKLNYRQNNKEVINEKNMVYCKNNKEAIAERMKVYYQNNKDKMKTRKNEKITCECGCVISRGSLATHCKSKRHIDLMNNKNNIEVIHNG